MKKLLMIAAASLLSFGANAADYNLIQVISSNPFAPSGSDLCPGSLEDGIACGGTASFTSTTDGSAVTVTDVQYAFASVNADFLYDNGNWNTAFANPSAPGTDDGGGTVFKAGLGETCTGTPGAPNPGSGCGNDFLGDWVSGTGFWDIAPDGQVTDYGGTININVYINADGNLAIERASPFPVAFEVAPGFFIGAQAGNDYIFEPAPIPVPAAVWLFGSALGLLGWARRRAA